MTPRQLASWTVQSAAVGALVACASWGLMRRSARSGSDAVVLRPLSENPSGRELADLAWSIRHEGVADAIRDARPEPYVPADERPAPAQAPSPGPAPDEEAAGGAQWAAPLAAALRAPPPARSAKRPGLRMVSLGPPEQGISLGSAAPEAARPEPVFARAPGPQEEEAPPPREAPPRRPAPIRRSAVATFEMGPSPPRVSGLAAQRGTVYEETEEAPAE